MEAEVALRLRPLLRALGAPGRAVVAQGEPMRACAVVLTAAGVTHLGPIPFALLRSAVAEGVAVAVARRGDATVYRLGPEGRAAAAAVAGHAEAQRARIESLEAEVAGLRRDLRQSPLETVMASEAEDAPATVFGLSRTQSVIVRALESRKGRIVPRETLMAALRAAGSTAQSQRILDVQMTYIRKRRPDLAARICTEQGVGFGLDCEAAGSGL